MFKYNLRTLLFMTIVVAAIAALQPYAASMFKRYFSPSPTITKEQAKYALLELVFENPANFRGKRVQFNLSDVWKIPIKPGPAPEDFDYVLFSDGLVYVDFDNGKFEMLLKSNNNFAVFEVLETRGFFTIDQNGVWHATATSSELQDHRLCISIVEDYGK